MNQLLAEVTRGTSSRSCRGDVETGTEQRCDVRNISPTIPQPHCPLFLSGVLQGLSRYLALLPGANVLLGPEGCLPQAAQGI